MGRSSAARSAEIPDLSIADDWTTSVIDAPAGGREETRGRMRVLRGGAAHGGRDGNATPALELLQGPQPARVSWHSAEPGVTAAVGAIDLWLHRLIGRPWVPAWWREHQPLVVQRILIIILVLQALVLALQLR
jgi:hypothetical protein